jgi:Flp pilus assembly protein TadD
VAPFENRSGVRVFDWLVAGAPFEIASKTEAVLALEPAGGPLFVGGTQVSPIPMMVAAFAKEQDARYVITGWVERPNWQLRIAIAVWKVDGGAATLVHEATREGPVPSYHALLGQALTEAWTKAGVVVDEANAAKLERPLAVDLYAVNLMGRGLGNLTGALGGIKPGPIDPVIAKEARAKQLASAERDLEKSVFIDPKCYEAQRLVGELYLAQAAAGGDPKLLARAAGKFAYANDLAPDDPQALRAAAVGAAKAGKHEVARGLFRKLVVARPWDLDLRYQLGEQMWHTGDAAAAQQQLEQVTKQQPGHLPARRVLVLIHASRSDTQHLVSELEAIAKLAPADLEVKADLASAYGALGQWDKATTELETIAGARAPDLALLVRIGDGHRRQGQLDRALEWYARASKAAPDSSLPGFTAAQALLDANRLPEAIRVYTGLQKFKDQLAAAEQALGVIAFQQNRPDDAAWYLRRATRGMPRSLPTWRALIAAELLRNDAALALLEGDRAFAYWPTDGHLRYLEGIARAKQGQRSEARTALLAAIAAAPELAAARAALGSLDAGGGVKFSYTPEVVRPWGDADEVAQTLDRYALTSSSMAAVRMAYETQFLVILGALGKGPYAPVKTPAPRACPLGRVAPMWAAAQQELRRYERLGVELESTYRYLARHDDAGATAGLLPNARTQLQSAKKTYRTAIADIAELRAMWTRGLGPELRAVGCNDKLLAAAVANPERYRVIVEDKVAAIPDTQPPRTRPRATFYVDNSRCPDPVDVWIDGNQLGQVAPGRRSALVADGGKRTLCLLGPGAAQCGDRGTVRQVYLHDGWSVTLHCPK